jgi:hypothetical protein
MRQYSNKLSKKNTARVDPPSSFTWLDYSEKERRKMLDAIRLFKDQDTRDELGVGTVRDAFADLLFPGTGTAHSSRCQGFDPPLLHQ